jgi:hypothetical protein
MRSTGSGPRSGAPAGAPATRRRSRRLSWLGVHSGSRASGRARRPLILAATRGILSTPAGYGEDQGGGSDLNPSGDAARTNEELIVAEAPDHSRRMLLLADPDFHEGNRIGSEQEKPG